MNMKYLQESELAQSTPFENQIKYEKNITTFLSFEALYNPLTSRKYA